MPILLKWRDATIELPLTSPATVDQVLSAALAAPPPGASFHAPSLSLLVKGRRLALPRDAGTEVTAAAGRPLLLYGSTAQEAHEAAHPPQDARLKNDLPGSSSSGGPREGYLFRPGALPPAGRSAAAPFIGHDGHDGAPRYGWGRVSVVEGLPDSEGARALLLQLASHRGVLAVMRRRGWFVPELGEMSPLDPPPKPGCIGYNVNHGQCIKLLLRNHGELQSFRRTKATRLGYDGDAVLDVLFHELSHNVAHPGGDHPPAFYALEKEIKDEAMAAAEWEDAGQGRALGGRRAGSSEVFEGWGEPAEGGGGGGGGGSSSSSGAGAGPRVLGGDARVQHALPPQEAARLAALLRQQQQQQQQQQGAQPPPP